MRFQVCVLLHASIEDEAGEPRRPNRDELIDVLDHVMEQLHTHGALDPRISSDGVNDRVEISVTGEAVGEFQAQQDGVILIRTAVHAAGIGTPDWTVEMGEATLQDESGPAELQWVETSIRSAETLLDA